MLRLTIIMTLFLCAMTVHGAVIIESIDDDGHAGKVTIDKGRARIDSGSLGGYILVNLVEATIYAINHKERAILDLRSPLLPTPNPHASQADKPATPPSITFKKIGKGPVISGYATLRYKVSVDGMHCFDEYLSEQLLNLPDVKRFAEVLGKATGADTESGMGIPFDSDAPCESADDLADDYYPKLGIPIKTVGSNGLTTHEITRVITDAKPPVGTFTSPPDYRRMTRAELADRAATRAPDHAQQGSGNLNIEDITKLQQQIKQQIEAMKKQRSQTVVPDEPTEQERPGATGPAEIKKPVLP